MKKNRMVGLPDGQKNFEDMCNRLDTIPACVGQTDILPRHSPHYAYASRSKMVSFTATRGNTFVGGARTLPSALLVYSTSIVVVRIWSRFVVYLSAFLLLLPARLWLI